MKRASWLWFFVPLLALGLASGVIPIVYNLALQLQPEQLAQARQLWRLKGTPDYDLAYLAKYDSMPEGDEVLVKVRGGKVVQLAMNGQVLLFSDVAVLALGLAVTVGPAQDYTNQTVEGLFDQIEAELHQDAAAPGRRNYATATFDRKDGHPIRYVHRVSGTKQRREWLIKLTRVAAPSNDSGEKR